MEKINSKCLNLGRGEEFIEGWVNLDCDKTRKADVYYNLNKFPWPFKDNEFDKVLASYVLEYLDDVSKAMMEIYRITKPNGAIFISAPHISSPFKWMELSHKHCFSYLTFGEWHNNKELYPYFELLKKKIVFTRINFSFMNKIINPIINLNPVIYERLFSGILPSADIIYIFRVRKDKEFYESKIKYMKIMENSKKLDNLKFIIES